MFAITPLALLALATPQAPNDVLATYQLAGKAATVTRTDVALEMAFHLRRRERGRQATEMIVDTMLTRRAAKQQGLMPTEPEVQAFWNKLKQQLMAAGRRPEDFAAVRNTGQRQWLDDLSVQIAQERLVRHELGLSENEKVLGDMLKLWLGEARQRASIETDPDKLPVGTVARVDKTHVALIDLGFLLLRTSEDSERDRFIRQVAFLNSIEAMADEHSLRVTPTDLDKAVLNRQTKVDGNARYSGVSFQQLLKAEGETIDSLRASRVFRSQILLDKLARAEYPDAVLQHELATTREAVLAEVGARRRLGAIFVRALEQPNAIIARDFEQARSHLEEVRKRIDRDGFAATASIESEDGPSKRKGGDVGWHRRSSKQLPKKVIEAAFALSKTEISMPIRTKQGCYVITVLDIEPTPNDEELLRRLRIVRAKQLSESIVAKADIKIAGHHTDTTSKTNGQESSGDRK